MIIKNGLLEKVYVVDIPKDGKFVVPDGVTKIDHSAFANCFNLTSVIIPDGVVGIGCWAFSECTELTSVTIPGSVIGIGTGAFDGCTNLTSITIGNGVTTIGRYAFSCCTRLTEVTIPDSVIFIEDHAFYGCLNLTSITIGNGVTNIEEDVFCYTSLKSVRKNYKAFRLLPDGGLFCRTKLYNVGEKASVKGELKLCENGIHYCTNLFEIFNHYDGEYGKDFVIAECEVSREQRGSGRQSSKRCARWIIPKRLFTREEVIKILNDGRAKK